MAQQDADSPLGYTKSAAASAQEMAGNACRLHGRL